MKYDLVAMRQKLRYSPQEPRSSPELQIIDELILGINGAKYAFESMTEDEYFCDFNGTNPWWDPFYALIDIQEGQLDFFKRVENEGTFDEVFSRESLCLSDPDFFLQLGQLRQRIIELKPRKIFIPAKGFIEILR